MKFFKNKKGFTLVELVVVIAILGILAGIAIPRFMDATATARGAKIVADMRTIDSAIMMYNAKTGVLPGDSADLLSDAPASGEAKAKVKLMAAWPVPPSGDATIVATDKTEIKINVVADTAYSISNGSCVITGADGTDKASVNSKSIDEILNK